MAGSVASGLVRGGSLGSAIWQGWTESPSLPLRENFGLLLLAGIRFGHGSVGDETSVGRRSNPLRGPDFLVLRQRSFSNDIHNLDRGAGPLGHLWSPSRKCSDLVC